MHIVDKCKFCKVSEYNRRKYMDILFNFNSYFELKKDILILKMLT